TACRASSSSRVLPTLVFADLRSNSALNAQNTWTALLNANLSTTLLRAGPAASFCALIIGNYVIKTIGSEEVEADAPYLQAYHGYIVECSPPHCLPPIPSMLPGHGRGHRILSCLVTRLVIQSLPGKIHRKRPEGQHDRRESTREKERKQGAAILQRRRFYQHQKTRISIGESQKHRLSRCRTFSSGNNLIEIITPAHRPSRPEIGGAFFSKTIQTAEDDARDLAVLGKKAPRVSPPSAAAAAAAALQPACLKTAATMNAVVWRRSVRRAVIQSAAVLYYFLGIIDILTSYGVRKRTASNYKSMKHGYNNENQLSTVRPRFMPDGFLGFYRRLY
uniref:PIPK domain-containing protein n=1 Tax=Macrostomum lignano TaxID=282301 RepID=A0A1I8F4D6_9PLAT